MVEVGFRKAKANLAREHCGMGGGSECSLLFVSPLGATTAVMLLNLILSPFPFPVDL